MCINAANCYDNPPQQSSSFICRFQTDFQYSYTRLDIYIRISFSLSIQTYEMMQELVDS